MFSPAKLCYHKCAGNEQMREVTMLDITNVLVHKLTLPVTLSPNLNQTRNASEIVKDILHSRLESTLGLHIPRVCFGMG